MRIKIRDKRLQRLIEDYSKLQREYGVIRAKKIVQRLNDLTDVQNLEEARSLPGRLHELVGNRRGQWAMYLDGLWRLIMAPVNDPIPENEDGQFIWVEIIAVEIVEVVDYHK